MKQLNFTLILFCLFLFTSSAFALTYRADLNVGSWSQYNTGLASYETDLLFNTYNRGFEGADFNFNHHSGANQLLCDSMFCSLYNNSSAEGIQHASRSSTYAHTGTYSLKINTDGSATELFWSKNRELIGDVNISFWAMSTNVDPNEAWVGYIDDRNNFTIGATLSAGTEEVWRHYSFTVPTGNYTWAVSGNTTGFYIDDISITRNNTGTFRTTDPQFCGSINSCSNIAENFPAQQLGTLYWTIDYVAGATCSWAKDGVSQGLMTEGQTGMYYALIDTPTTSSNQRDLNLSASCSKIPFNTKTFFVTAPIYRYGLLPNGNFSTTDINFYSSVTNQAYCTTAWCGRFNNTGEYIASNNRFQAGLGATAGGATPIWKFKDGRETLLVRAGNWDTLIWSQEYAGSATISFWINVWNVGTGVIEYGYVNDSNSFTQVGSDLTKTLGAWQYISYSIPAGNYRPAWHNTLNADYFLDHVTSSLVKQTSTMTIDNNLTSNYGLRGTNYAFNSSYKNGSNQPITDGNCWLVVNGTSYTMTYNAGTQKYSYATGFIADGTYSIKHSCQSVSYNDQNSTYSIIIATAGTQILTLTPIQNVQDYTISNFTPNVHLDLTNNNDDVIFSIINNSTPTAITFDWLNFANTNGKQYTVYTSTNGTDWTFDDSATFGDSVNYNDPIQKIPTISGHSYAFTDTLPNATKVYYKLVFNQLPLAWETIDSSADWVNVNDPTVYTDTNNNKWDLFADSNYTPIRSYTSKRFPDLTSVDLTTGFEIQFTAYADQASNLKVGYTIDGVDTTSTVQITTAPHRYSVPVDPTSNEARLLIKSDGNNTNVYITDYAIVPKAYFTGRLEVLNNDGSPLKAIINEGVSKAYIREAIPYTIRTSAYDKDGDLHRLSVQASIGGITIKSQDFFLKDATQKDKVFTWDELIDGFVDLDGNAVYPVGMRSIYIKAVLYNNAGESVSEQSTTVKILQYPYFEGDIGFNLYSLNAKVGENPAVRLNLVQSDPSQLIGIKLYIYDVNHSLTSPNYSTTILNDALGCKTFNCSKDLLVDDYVFEAETQYRIAVQLLLKTERESFTNPLTLKIFNQQVTYRQYETARILQVFERQDHTYRNDEPVALVLQLRDVPYKNLSGDTTVYITADLCTGSSGSNCYAFGETKFYPKSFIYDETTGYNYYYFDQLFYTDGGALLPDGNYIRFQANITDKKYTHKIAEIPTATLADKCASASYGSLFNDNWFNMNFWDALMSASQRALFGCGTLTSPIVETGDAEEVRVLIDADHNVVGGQNQSIACLKIDNQNFQNSLEQDLVCGVLWNRNQQNIDKFTFTIGNENSDYSKIGNSAQYLQFDVPAEQLIFNDTFMLSQALNSEYGTDTIDTVGEVFFYGFDKLFSGVANPLTDVLEGTTKTGLITNFGFDINWSNQLDPTFVKGIFFFKVKGLKVVNQYDYIKQFPALENTNPKYFREFANQNKLKLPIQSTVVNIYANDLSNWNLVGNQLDSIETASPLIIYAKPSYVQTSPDKNQVLVATTLKFNLTSDMLSNNQTSTQRVFLPLTFSYIPPVRTDLGAIVEDILYGTDSSGKPAGLLTNPVGFGFKNWFWFLLAVIAILLLSLIIRNFRTGGGGIYIPFFSPFWEGMAGKQYVHNIRKGRGN